MKSHLQCQKKESANPGQLFQAFGPHQQGAAQSLPGTAGLKVVPGSTEQLWLMIHMNNNVYVHVHVYRTPQCTKKGLEKERDIHVYVHVHVYESQH